MCETSDIIYNKYLIWDIGDDIFHVKDRVWLFEVEYFSCNIRCEILQIKVEEIFAPQVLANPFLPACTLFALCFYIVITVFNIKHSDIVSKNGILRTLVRFGKECPQSCIDHVEVIWSKFCDTLALGWVKMSKSCDANWEAHHGIESSCRS